MFIIKLPSLSEQQKIALVFLAADKEIENHQQELEALKQQKKGATNSATFLEWIQVTA
jgi:restriction endonuclease S subunit